MKALFLSTALFAATVAPMASADQPIIRNFQAQVNPALVPVLPPNVLIICPDLRVSLENEFVMPSLNVRTTVRIENIGPHNYVSNPGQQRVRVRIAGAFGTQEELSYNFTNLAQGHAREWSFVRDLQGAPMSVNARVLFSPVPDTNPFNNDCNGSNNSANIST